MTNYLLSIDPSIKNTGFTLWEKESLDSAMKRTMGKCSNVRFKYGSYECLKNECEICDSPLEFKWKPIWVNSCNFKEYNMYSYVIKPLEKLVNKNNVSKEIWMYDFKLIIERGTFHSKNGIGYETQEHLRGFIAGQFNKLLTKDMLISPSEWKKYISNNILDTRKIKWNKEISLAQANELIKQNNWNITISNHDEADSLLIGWYYLNKEKK